MAEKDYSHRSPIDKLGIKAGHAVVLLSHAWPLDQDLCRLALERAGRGPAQLDESADIVLISVDDSTDAVSLLREWRARIRPAGGIWLLTAKRGRHGYVNQNELIPAGLEAGMVDNKTCSVSETTRGIRFVIRKKDR